MANFIANCLNNTPACPSKNYGDTFHSKRRSHPKVLG